MEKNMKKSTSSSDIDFDDLLEINGVNVNNPPAIDSTIFDDIDTLDYSYLNLPEEITFDDMVNADLQETGVNPYETPEKVNESKVEVISEITKISKKFGLERRNTTFKLREIPSDKDPIQFTKEAIEEIISRIVQRAQDNDLIGFSFRNDGYTRDGYVPLGEKKEFNIGKVWDLLERIAQSNNEGINAKNFSMTSCHFQAISGRGRVENIEYDSYDDECKGRRSIIEIKNTDNLCLPRAIVVSLAAEKKDPSLILLKLPGYFEQELRARNLCEKAGVDLSSASMGYHELQLFQEHLGKEGYRIIVYKYVEGGEKELMYIGSKNVSLKNLYLYYHQNHFNVLTSLTAALVKEKICERCFKSYRTSTHNCTGRCWGCLNPKKCTDTGERKQCVNCNRTFLGQLCYNYHVNKNCNTYKKCLSCYRTYITTNPHDCDSKYCKTCKIIVPNDHRCFIPVNTENPPEDGYLYIFYDFEATQEHLLGNKVKDGVEIGEVFEHEVNLCVCKMICWVCLNENSEAVCICNNKEIKIFKENPVQNFLFEILKLWRKNCIPRKSHEKKTEKNRKIKKIIVIGHNAGGYDLIFILKEIVKNSPHNPEIIARGTRIIQMIMKKKIKFIDSLNFLPIPLRAFPSTFGLALEIRKGFFPHFFNTRENQNKILDRLPEIKYYSPDTMMEGERKEFLKWYNENKDSKFDFNHEIVEYCKNDVEILVEGCLKFRKFFLDICRVDPLYECLTLAGAGNLAFRRNFLLPGVISQVPRNGYRFADQQSPKAIHWLLYIEKQLGREIKHAGRGSEKKILGTKVDGFDENENTIYLFHGCYYHAHDCKLNNPFKPDVEIGKKHKSFTTQVDRYERTMRVTEKFLKAGYKVRTIYECDFNELCKKDKAVKEIQNDPILKVAKLDIRSSLYGGRTESFRSFYECKEGEKIKYIDICSLYPYVLKNKPFPVYHPKVILGDDCKKIELKNIHGFVKCKWLAPQNLLIPVLPFKQNSKLMFSLCFTCSQTFNESECLHTDEERAFIGNHPIPEVNKAVEVGYKILEIFEIWEYETLQYNPATKTEGLFSEYMNLFIKIKQEASGWPSHCSTFEKRKKYIEDFKRVEKIQLDSEKIEKNPALRTFAKNLLNSLWGKFSQGNSHLKSVIISNVDEMIDIIYNPKHEVADVTPLNEEKLLINYRMVEGEEDELPFVNVPIASYTTAYARLELYSYLEKLQDRIIYADTDSCVYLSRNIEGEYEPELGEFIGNMTSELSVYGEGAYITSFYSTAPKSYAYEVLDCEGKKHHITKMKGVRIDYEKGKKINFDSIKQLVKEKHLHPTIQVSFRNIRRLKTFAVITTQEEKIVQGNYNKRKFFENISTPFGFKRKK